MFTPVPLTCPHCGQDYQRVPLEPGQRALCYRCDSVLARGSPFGSDATLVFAITGLILAVPTLLLPFITAGKYGQKRGGLLFTGVDGLWNNDMPVLGIWVLLCGAVVPILLLAILAGALLPPRLGWPRAPSDFLTRTVHALSYWAIPEVQVLSVLVALMKLGSVVHVTIGFGFWAYVGMSFCLLLAWRSFTLQPAAAPADPAVPA